MKEGDKVKIGLLDKADYVSRDIGWADAMTEAQGEKGYIQELKYDVAHVCAVDYSWHWWLLRRDISLVDKFLVECPFCGNELNIPLEAGRIEVVEDDVETDGCGELLAVIVEDSGDVRKQWKLIEAASPQEVKDVQKT